MVNQTNFFKKFTFFLVISAAFAQDAISNINSLEITKSQESKTVSITAIVNTIETNPTAYRFSVYARSKSAEPFIQKLFFPNEPIQIILPLDILSSDTLGNIAKLEPLGDKYSIQYRMFNKQDNEIKLTLYEVLKPADILKLTILNKESKKPVSNVNTLAFQNGELLSSSKSDSLGFSRLRIPLNREKDIPINILIDTDGKFQLYRREIVIKEGTSEEIIMLTSLKLEIGETVYQVIDDLVPFREGPENGSSVLFFLNSGEQVVVSKVAGDRLFGRVNVFLEMQGRYKNVNGWILHKYVIIKDI
ncbi:MAG: hypothetical protein HOK88_07440 [Candidatus Marinimicrobia bacterium]|nr:hypothetical protein [Candidatus Neomarinimicrobiota bacterium]MBT7422772.1 hypothetical protein [Candidatus Neomarinimicrobiota bacterium]